MRRHFQAFQLALGFGALYLLLRSRQYMAVDGTLRCLDVYFHPAVRLHGNNHMLYPFWIWLWTRVPSLAGHPISDPLAFVSASQAMNAVASAITVGLLYSLLRAIAGNAYALLGSLLFGFSTAVVLHATNSAEPVVGLMFSMGAAVALVPALLRNSKPLLFLTGILLALALASYQSMVLIAPAIALFCLAWPVTGEQRWRTPAMRLLTVAAGGATGVIVIYGWAYARQGVPWLQMPTKFLAIGGGPEIYAYWSVSKLVNFPLGYVRNLYFGLPSDYRGIRSLLRHPQRSLWIASVLFGFAVLTHVWYLIGTGLVAAVRRSGLSKMLLGAGIPIAMLAVVFPLLYWGPYDKLWLQPLALFVVAGGFAFGRAGLSQGRRRALVAGLGVLLVAEVGVNLPQAIADHIHPTPGLNEAREFAAMVGPRDAVVLAFDDISTLWVTFWGQDANVLLLPASRYREAAEWLARTEKDETQRGGSLYFVGVLDQDRKTWDDFLGNRIGIPYSSFETYRQRAARVREYRVRGVLVAVCRLSFAGSAPLPAEVRP